MDFHPEKIVSMILAEFKRNAEVFLAESVADVIMTVPACFNDKQRQSTIDAAKIAGFKEVRLINEPTATAIAYGYNLEKKTRTVLVFDLGGGHLDVSVLTFKGDKYKIRSTASVMQGGEDFDSHLVDFVIEQFKKEHNTDITTSTGTMYALRRACEEAKYKLSIDSNAFIKIMFEGKKFTFFLDRASFEIMISDFCLAAIECVETALFDCGVDKNSIDEVILSGGSSYIPKIQELLQRFFEGKVLKAVHPKSIVAHGAAIFATNFNKIVIEEVATTCRESRIAAKATR